MLFLSEDSLDNFAIALVEIGTDKQQKPQANECYDTINRLKSPNVVDKDLDDGNNE